MSVHTLIEELLDQANQTNLPPGWNWARLGELVIIRGQKLPPDGSSPLPFIGMDDVPPGSLRATSHGWFRDMKSAANAVEPSDILYGRLRPYLNKVALAEVTAAVSGEFIVLKAADGIDPRYVQFVLHARHFVNFAARDTSGDRPRIDFAKIAAYEVPVPPSAEQRRIVARIDELFAEIAEGEAALERARKDLDTWRRALLKAAVTGELTRDWRETNYPNETGASLLARIGTALGGQGRRSPTEPPDAADLPEIPTDWAWGRLSNIGEVTGGLTKNPDREGYEEKLPFLRVTNVQMGKLDLTDMRKIGVRPGERSRLLLARNDLLVVEGNGSIDQIGRCALWADEIQPCVHQNHIIKVRFLTPELAAWALRWLLSPNGRSAIRSVASSTSGLHTLSISKIENLPIPVPPTQETVVILHRLENTLSEEADTNIELDEAQRLASVQRQSILKSAFKGRLVSRDSADEPASAMLARLREAGVAAPPSTRRGRARPQADAQGTLPL